MKCVCCNGTGMVDDPMWADEKHEWQYCVARMKKCPACGGSGEIVRTNEEWFCGLSTEEKAEVIAEKIRHAQLQYVPTYGTFTNSDWWEKWLKEKHTIKEQQNGIYGLN